MVHIPCANISWSQLLGGLPQVNIFDPNLCVFCKLIAATLAGVFRASAVNLKKGWGRWSRSSRSNCTSHRETGGIGTDFAFKFYWSIETLKAFKMTVRYEGGGWEWRTRCGGEQGSGTDGVTSAAFVTGHLARLSIGSRGRWKSCTSTQEVDEDKIHKQEKCPTEVGYVFNTQL